MKLSESALSNSSRWVGRILGYGIAGVICYALISSYVTFRIGRNLETCSMWGQDSAAKAQTPLIKAKSLAACIDRHNTLPERMFFWRTMKMLDSLPNAPCKYVGVWTSTRPGSVFRVTMDDSGAFTADLVTGRSNTESASGSWGAADGKLVWFYDEGLVWPPDANPIQDEEADRFTLVERNGVHTQFTRLDTVESKTCNTTGVRIGHQNDAPAKPTVDTTALLPKRDVAPPLAQWIGQYGANDAPAGEATQIQISNDGQYSATLRCAGAGSEPARQTTTKGSLRPDEGWYKVETAGGDECRLPSRLYPLEADGQRYLLTDAALTDIVNRLNAGQPVNASRLLQTASGTTPAWTASQPPALPKPYGEAIKATPLTGKLGTFGTVGATSRAALLQPRGGEVEYRASAALDLGTKQGVIPGMVFYPQAGPESARVEVIEADLDRAKVRISWKGDWRPSEGLVVSTASGGRAVGKS
ncbi:hypothetical protein [Andreprevotia chitinilytica]|uniref:hypothetical protein n=1 Tax=Andreprevotia chitinilytica TaxID=396808 RepID=UPI000558F465|nr:hypothetical protein [Andreprevotia chitinilytica]